MSGKGRAAGTQETRKGEKGKQGLGARALVRVHMGANKFGRSGSTSAIVREWAGGQVGEEGKVGCVCAVGCVGGWVGGTGHKGGVSRDSMYQAMPMVELISSSNSSSTKRVSRLDLPVPLQRAIDGGAV